MTAFISKLITHKKRGITLLETLLALAVGTVVIVASIQGVNRFTENVQVQASASQLDRLIEAVDTWADDNYDDLINNAPQVFNANNTITELSPYLGQSFPVDAFRNRYRLATRTYTYQVPDLATADPTDTFGRDALQVLLVGFNNNPGSLATEDDIRVNIANAAGAKAGFISTDIVSCSDGAGGTLPAGNICGAFGSYALPATFFPASALNNAVVVGLITKGDSSFYGDQLYRYNFNDPDLNTMRTTLFMDSPTDPNEIVSPRFDLRVRSAGDIEIDPGDTSRTVFFGSAGKHPIIRSNSSTLQINEGTERVRLGDLVDRSFTAPDGTTIGPIMLGTAQLTGNLIFSELMRVDTINSTFQRPSDPLRLQNFNRGQVIIGERARYQTASQGNISNATYEVSNGQLIAGQVNAQDFTCADCGGNLSEILPRWRHMGTYFIPYTSGAGTLVPKPACTGTKRNALVRNATSDDAAFAESPEDERYQPSILLIPRQIQSKTFADGLQEADGTAIPAGTTTPIPFDSELRAFNQDDNFWRVELHKTGDNVFTTAFAMTYCVFTGGTAAQADPSSTFTPGMFDNIPADHGTWTVIDP